MAKNTQKLRKDAIKHIVEIKDRHRFWKISIHFGQNETYRTVALIDKAWKPDKVASALERLAKRTGMITLQGTEATRGK